MTEIPAGALASAARALARAGRWAQASALLDETIPAGPGERAVLAVAAAEVAVEQDFMSRTNGGSTALDRARAALADVQDADELAFDLDFLLLKHDYAAELFGAQGTADGGSRAVRAGLADRAARLDASAPDRGRQASAAFYAGVVAHNLLGDADAGRRWFEQAQAAGEEAGDELIVSTALRHLGYLARENGDTELARRQLERSLALRQRAGCVPLVLAQQQALAELAGEVGDTAWARVVAGQVHAWAGALDCGWLEGDAAALLAQTRPAQTRPAQTTPVQAGG